MSPPELNDMEKIYRNTVDKGLQLIAFSRKKQMKTFHIKTPSITVCIAADLFSVLMKYTVYYALSRIKRDDCAAFKYLCSVLRTDYDRNIE